MSASKVLPIVIVVLHAAAAAQSNVQQPSAPSGPAPQTIGQLSEKARNKQLNPNAPPEGMRILPGTEILAGTKPAGDVAPAKLKIERKQPPPEVLPSLAGIFGIGPAKFQVELADAFGVRRYSLGQVTPSGWTIESISKTTVEITKPDPKAKELRSILLRIPM